jgi:hypothetical protein
MKLACCTDMVKNIVVFKNFKSSRRKLMRKLITLVAATTLLVSPFALAEDTQSNGNPNDVMQTAQPQNMNVADADQAAAPAAAADQAAAPAEKPAAKKHHAKKHHAKKHHHKKAAPAESTSSEPAKTSDAAPAEQPAEQPAAQ